MAICNYRQTLVWFWDTVFHIGKIRDIDKEEDSMSAVNQVWPCKRTTWLDKRQWQLKTFVNLLFNCQPSSIFPNIPDPVCAVSLPACQSTPLWEDSVQPAVPSNHTSNPLTLLCPLKWQWGESDGCDEESRRKRKKGRVSAPVLSVGGGSACLAIRGSLFKGEKLLTICLPMREQRQWGNLLFLISSFSNKDEAK